MNLVVTNGLYKIKLIANSKPIMKLRFSVD